MNLPLALLVLMGGSLLIYTGIKNPPGGIVGVLGSALQGARPGTTPPPRNKALDALGTPASKIPNTKPPTTTDVITGGIYGP